LKIHQLATLKYCSYVALSLISGHRLYMYLYDVKRTVAFFFFFENGPMSNKVIHHFLDLGYATMFEMQALF
jgi:hypothetical protein